MQIDYALILSAGLGTRMGEIGKKIPKVLWPVYFKTLLELQIRYCEDLGVRKIYINTHFLHDEIAQFLATSGLDSKVIVLHEEPLLDSGGAIHNLAARKEVAYKGNLLLVNGDQFLFFDKKYWEEALAKIDHCRAVLFGIKVPKDSAYNETILNNGRLTEIKKNLDKSRDYVTYSGLGVLNLDGLKPTPGISRFFETVANYKDENVQFVTAEKFEYWDFGTADIYAENILKLNQNENRTSEMGIFLQKHGAFLGEESKFINAKLQSIDVDYTGAFSEKSIHGKGLTQKY